ncbi:phosphoribosylanthranilate isomerase [bacterium]|nr:phosphoribosylanthranilate isomerase [bacterium]
MAWGADALGLVASMPSGPGPIPEKEIARIAAEVPVGVSAVLLTSRTDPAEIIEQQRQTRTDSIQLCAWLEADAHVVLKRELPGIRLMQVVHVTGEESYTQAIQAAKSVHGLLLDTGAPKADTPVLGGTGKTHDWSISQRIVRDCNKPVYLAGGLNAGNVVEAIRKVRPWGVDICTGVRKDMLLDDQKLADYVRAVKSI